MEKTQITYLTFKLHEEHFAVDVFSVEEVLHEYKIMAVPEAPEYIEGMVNFRGNIVPIINFRKKFQFPENETDKNKIIVLSIEIRGSNVTFGAIVDKVKNVFKAEPNELKEKPEFGSKYNPEYVTGMIYKNDDFYMILDLERVFSDTEINILNEL